MGKKKSVALLSGFGEEEKKEKLAVVEIPVQSLNKEIVAQSYDFEYCESDEIKDYLTEQSVKVQTIVSKGHTEIGRVLKETQERLSGDNQYNGYFEKWYTSQGFNKKGVYRYINRFNLISSCQNDTTKELIESMPITLSYEISNPNCPDNLKEAVLKGEIKTLKEFNARKLIDYSKGVDSGERPPVSIETLNDKFNAVMGNRSKIIERIKKIEVDETEMEKAMSYLEKIEKDFNKLMKFLKVD